MNALQSQLEKLIRLQGPIPLSTFMNEALGHAEHGYYMKQDPLGKAGDFTTAPEISQMFGEMIGLWFVDIWMRAGQPPKIHLAELGPGRGTLMQDILRTFKLAPALLAGLEIHLVEMSPALTAKQKDTLSDYAPQWHPRLGDVLESAHDAPLFLIANEFFDALPIRQFQKGPEGWHERLVGLDGDALAFLLAPEPLPNPPLAPNRAEEGSIAEYCPLGENIITDIAEHVKECGGAALIVDYGYSQGEMGDTLQAVKNHEYAALLENPGDVDLTAHVNFQLLKSCAEKAGAKVAPAVTQGEFLTSLGIMERAKTLSSNGRGEEIMAALNRLISEEEMGRIFKVMAISDPGFPEGLGFS